MSKEIDKEKNNGVVKAEEGIEKSRMIDEQSDEYRRLLSAHHRYTEKIRNISSGGFGGMDVLRQERLRDLDTKRNLLHRQILDFALQIGKNSSDVITDLFLLDGNAREYGVDLPLITWENSPDLAKLEKARMKYRMTPEEKRKEYQDYQPIGQDEVFIPVGTEVGGELDADGMPVSTYQMYTDNQEPVVRTFIFSRGFKERMKGIVQLVHDHPHLARLFATGAFVFHNSTRSYGVIAKKINVIELCGLLRDEGAKYLPLVESESIEIHFPIEAEVANAKDPAKSEMMLSIPNEMLCYEDLEERLGETAAEDYLKARFG